MESQSRNPPVGPEAAPAATIAGECAASVQPTQSTREDWQFQFQMRQLELEFQAKRGGGGALVFEERGKA